MIPPSVTIVDYGMGNLRSLSRALERAGASVAVTDDRRVLEQAERLVIPGQGAFGQAMKKLDAGRLSPILEEAIHTGKPVLGVCLGLQILYERSAEAPGQRGLSIISGEVELLPLAPGMKRPHMGWAEVHHHADHPVFAANPSGEPFYFVHSYAALDAVAFCKSTCTHSVPFIAAIARGSLVATQFHPEKSQAAGERMLRAWLQL